MSDERRREKRELVLVEVLWEGSTGHYNARTSDLSMGGCFIDTIGQVTAGERLKFKLRVSDDEWLEVEGAVTYAYPNVGFGVQFMNISEIDKKKLERLLHPEAKDN